MLAKLSLCLPARGMSGCGPTALVRPDRDGRRSKETVLRRGASEQSGWALRPAATGAELRPAVDLRGAFGNKVNHAVAGFGLCECLSGALGLGPRG